MESYQSSRVFIVTSDSEDQCDVDAVKQKKTGAPANSQRNDFVDRKSSVRGGTNPVNKRSTSLPGGTEDVTSLKRAAVETLAIPLKISAPSLKISAPSLKISSEWNL